MIDSLEFKFVEYFIIKPSGKTGLMSFSRFNEDYIFWYSLVYRDTQEAIKLLKDLNKSDLNWK